MAELIAEGMIGVNHDFTWKFYNDGTLSISGQGVLTINERPNEWNEELAHAKKFRRVVFENGITEIIVNWQWKDNEYISPIELVLPESIYFYGGDCDFYDEEPIVLFIHSIKPPKIVRNILAKIVYVPNEQIDVYEALFERITNKAHVLAMPPVFNDDSVVIIKNSNIIKVTTYRSTKINIFTEDGSLVLSRFMTKDDTEIIKKAGLYIVNSNYNDESKQQRIRILADYIEPENNK